MKIRIEREREKIEKFPFRCQHSLINLSFSAATSVAFLTTTPPPLKQGRCPRHWTHLACASASLRSASCPLRLCTSSSLSDSPPAPPDCAAEADAEAEAEEEAAAAASATAATSATA